MYYHTYKLYNNNKLLLLLLIHTDIYLTYKMNNNIPLARFKTGNGMESSL